MKIKTLEFTNYRAFYGTHTLSLAGKNAFIYGENGSGKSSLYEGLKQFFASANPAYSYDADKTRHLKVSPYQANKTTLTQTDIKAIFVDTNNPNLSETRAFGTPVTDTTQAGHIKLSYSNYFNIFLSYRELLKTHFTDDVHDQADFKRKFGWLLVGTILSHCKGNNNKKIADYVHELERRRQDRAVKDKKVGELNTVLNGVFISINLIINEILHYFDENISIELVNAGAHVDYTDYHEAFYPVDVVVTFFNDKLDNHLNVLNEARLSAIAISIYLASLVIIPPPPPENTSPYKILFLDDIFVGLDMSNRLPLLDILAHFKKPKIAQTINKAGEIEESILGDKNGNIIFESETPFFADYQIFITTHDRHWFELGKQWLENKAKGAWCFFELYVDNFTHGFDVPFIQKSESHLGKALQAERRFDYASAGNYLRKAVEEMLNKKFKGIILKNGEGEDVEKLAVKLQQVIRFLESIGQDTAEFKNIAAYVKSLMNPLSHYNIETPIFKKELKDITTALQNLQNFPDFSNTKIFLQKDEEIHFVLNMGASTVNYYAFNLIENCLGCKIDGQIFIQPIEVKSCACWEVKNGIKGKEIPFLVYQNTTLESAIEKIVAFENKSKGLSLPAPNVLTDCLDKKNNTLEARLKV